MMMRDVAREIDRETATTKKTRAMRIIANQLLSVFKDHIGSENAISRKALYRKVFREKYDAEELGSYMRWEFVKQAMHFLRKRSNCFIAGDFQGGKYAYFVVRSREDGMLYVSQAEQKIKKMAEMQQRAMLSVKERWYAKEWKIEGRSSKAK